MAISNYTDLRAAVTNFFMGRSDLATYADDFIALSEAYFNAQLRCREMEAIDTLTPVSGVCTLPSDYLEYKRVVELSSIRRPLAYVTEEIADQYYPTRVAGLSAHFMIIGDELTALPISANDIEITYYRSIPALSEAAPTNWLLTRLPNLYLHCCLFYAAELVKDQEQLATENAIVQRYMDMLQAQSDRSKFAAAGIMLSGPTP